jgi:prolyl-tRNA editing enzyme YbaK/EbsC (Cys-tRNA(Pro) deacylase)
MIDKSKILNSSGPKRISKYLIENNLDINLVILDTTARTAEDAAKSIGVKVGAIVKSLVFNLKEDLTGYDHMILALIAGDRKCDILALEKLTGYRGELLRPDADFVKSKTGYSIGGVSPLGLPPDAKVYVDKSLNRFEEIWAAAGHPFCVYKCTYNDLISHSKGIESDFISV